MKEWAPHHPKAKLMEQKRAQILAAARESFLRNGYDGTSMEAVAALSGISIMTLYRHAANKDDLFSTVVLISCSEEEKTELLELTSLPLRENLAGAAAVIRQKLVDPKTVSLVRMVVGEVARFPHLAEMTYRSLIGHFVSKIEELLSHHEESRHLDVPAIQGLATAFVHRLVGIDVFRALLGLADVEPSDETPRVQDAIDVVLGSLGALKEAP